MEMYILDSLLRRIEVVDKFESFLWTERFSSIGDFVLDIHSTRATRNLFQTGTRVSMNKSHRVMEVKTVTDAVDEDGKALLKVKGYSLESLLQDRVAKGTMSNLTVEPKWSITDFPADVARTMFDHICRDGALDLADIIPFLQPGTFLPVSTIPEPDTMITWEQTVDSLYNALKSLCNVYDLGFRLVRNYDTSQLYFDVYTGDDRTTRQSLFPPVIFAPNFDNLQNTEELTTTEKSKNVAYVFSEVGFAVVYPAGVDPAQAQGLDRRVLMVNATDVNADTLNIAGALEQAGREALAQNKALSAFDGELNQNSEYKYGTDYNLGDLVELRNEDDIITSRRVNEQIFVHDTQGERSYPTLMANDFIMSGTWLTMGDVHWDELTEHWDEL